MLVDLVFHWCIDMAGAASFWCILKGCQNPEHQHSRFVLTSIKHPWLLQALFAIPVAIVTVLLIG